MPDLPRPAPPARMAAGAFDLRALSIEHVALEQALSRDPEVTRWTHYPPNMDHEQARARVERAQERAAVGATQRYVITDVAGEALGTCGIGRLDEETPEVFYALLPHGRGRGAATEAVSALCRWAGSTGRYTVSLLTIDGNGASERVAERAGFAPAGSLHAEQRGTLVTLRRWMHSAAPLASEDRGERPTTGGHA